VDGLRPQAHVAQHGNAGAHEPRDHVGLAGRALELDGLAAGLFQQPGARLDRRADTEMLEREREIDDDEGKKKSA
jgi:hypothetical protein